MRAKTGREAVKRKSLVDVAKAAAEKKPKSWLTVLTPEQQAECMEVGRLMARGEIKAGCIAVSAALREAGISVSKNGLANLVDKFRRGELK